MKLLFLSKNGPTAAARQPKNLPQSSSWPWRAYCHRPKTLSFRGGGDDFFRTINSAFIEDDREEDGYGEDDKENINEENSIETVINGARSEGRLFFEPTGETSSVLAVEAAEGTSAGELGEEGVAMCVHVESRNPYMDFRMSMEEMVEAHALTGKWDSLEDLLHCYLRVNDRTNHGYIFRAFVDLLLTSGHRPPGTPTDFSGCSGVGCDTVGAIPRTTSSPCSPLSFYTSSSSCCSSTDSLSTTPCCISIAGEAEENSSNNSGSVGTGQELRRQPSPLKVEQKRLESDDQIQSSSTSSSS
ncbi:hypothetical protein SAY87_008984 [Trapa incisa]|uniref:Transcription repressor n=1 Tax=Trapa incisa TaxID=236973 RepID=A0AAN7JY17_9MYRT|nr:hypothetical protein SAY87_008984 [Trapa incisa]